MRKPVNRGRVSGRRMMLMPLTQKAKERKYGYDQVYLKQNVRNVVIPFNKRKKEDTIILEWLDSRSEGKTAYIKRLILDDMGYVQE